MEQRSKDERDGEIIGMPRMRVAIGWTQNCATENDPRTRSNAETLIVILPQTFFYFFISVV